MVLSSHLIDSGGGKFLAAMVVIRVIYAAIMKKLFSFNNVQ